MKKVFLHLAFIVVLFCSFPLQAQITININPQKDNTLYESLSGTLSDGAGDHFFVGKTNAGLIRRGLLKFDIASNVPSGATILEATLTLTMDQTSSASSNIELHVVSADWGEGASFAPPNGGMGATAQVNDATWLHTFYNTSSWSKPGGDFNSTVSATSPVNAVGNYSWTSPQMATDVQNWLNAPNTNFGWCLVGDEANLKTTKRFASREITNASNSPRLTVIYSPSVGVQETNTASLCSFFPNPTSGIMQLSIQGVANPEVMIFNVMGKIVYSETKIKNNHTIDISKEPEGVYFYELLSNRRMVETGKIIIRK